MEGPANLYQRRQEIARERMPSVHPPLTAFRMGMDGTFWIDLRETEEGPIALVLDEDGRPLAHVLLPPRTTIRQATRSHIWVTERNEFDLASVVRYRVEGVPGGPE